MAFSHEITSEMLSKLLAALSDDEMQAGVEYTKLRNSLIRVFALKGDSDPEDSADETLDRVALKISKNTPIPDVFKFSFGVARLVFLERVKLNVKEKIAAQGFYGGKVNISPEQEKTDDFINLRECFEHLSDDDKNLLRDYFADLPSQQLNEHRQLLASRKSESINTLRVKIFRLRLRLQNCLREKL